MNIYTKTGDKGQTSLANGKRVPKTDLRIEAYGTSDELNSLIGYLRVVADTEQLRWIQNRLFDLGACLAGAEMHLNPSANEKLEAWIDEMAAVVPPLRAFVLPAGNEAAARAHLCRTVTRRLERNMLLARSQYTDLDWQTELVFVNRLSDYFFMLARFIMTRTNTQEELWEKD